MFETVKEVEEEKVTKENNIYLTRDPTASLISCNVEYLDEIDASLMIEADATKDKESIRKLKDDSMFILNDLESTFYDKPTEKHTEKQK